MSSSSVFAGRSTAAARRYSDVTDGEVEFDIREDEEQGIKLGQTVDLLLAAGYFRARIKGLSAFDKVVGGMTWCITTCSFDLDIDLLFQENLTIGQKIALTEKIVAVLPRMKCPHRIEPHQIQGLDFIHIYPVVQWLVKRAIETKEETGDTIRQHSVHQFDKYHSLPEDVQLEELKPLAISTLHDVKSSYKPQRKYRRHDAHELGDEESRVHSTLLEYGRKYGMSRTTKTEKQDSEMSEKRAALDSGLEKGEDEETIRAEEERKIKALMSGMSATGTHEGKLTASAVGSIMGLQSEAIQQMASEYAHKQAELEKIEGQEKVGGVQHHKRMMASLQKQIQQQNDRIAKVQEKHDELLKSYNETKDRLDEVEETRSQLETALHVLDEQEAEADHEVLQKLRSLVALNEKLKQEEQEFRTQCKEEKAKLEEEIDSLKQASGGSGTLTEAQERSILIENQLTADRDKLHKIRLLLARKNREISALQRRIDEVPSRAELSQYQRRFVELYNQIAAKHKETKQFYTLYNKLDDTKLYLNKEVNLLNSIHDNFEQAMSSQGTKEQFLKQMENIVEGVKQNRIKLERKKQEEKMRRDQLNDQYLQLVDKQRLYFKTVKEFKEECRKNEVLLSKLQLV